jgi:hypothetical protein
VEAGGGNSQDAAPGAAGGEHHAQVGIYPTPKAKPHLVTYVVINHMLPVWDSLLRRHKQQLAHVIYEYIHGWVICRMTPALREVYRDIKDNQHRRWCAMHLLLCRIDRTVDALEAPPAAAAAAAAAKGVQPGQLVRQQTLQQLQQDIQQVGWNGNANMHMWCMLQIDSHIYVSHICCVSVQAACVLLQMPSPCLALLCELTKHGMHFLAEASNCR